jgi:hypothetical protein
MNRIYQGRVSKVEIQNILSASTGERNKGEVSNPNPWQPLPNWQDILPGARNEVKAYGSNHELFQDAVSSCQWSKG